MLYLNNLFLSPLGWRTFDQRRKLEDKLSEMHVVCLPTYCLRYSKRLKAIACRFGFPQPVCDEPKIERNHKGQWTFFPRRPQNDINLNRYHPLWIAIWRGNIDVSPVLSKDAAVNYISKYAAKAESMSSELDKIMFEYAREEPNDGGIQSIVTKRLTRLLIERDFSAQEACHQLLHIPMVECSRTFDSITLPINLTVTRVLRAQPRQT